MIRTIIIDDHASVRDSFRLTLEETGRYEVIAESSNASFALPLCRERMPDLVFMDVCTDAGASGLAATEQIKQELPKVKVIVMSGFDEITYAPRAKQAGADAFVYKSRSMSFFMEVAERVMQGETWFPEPKTIPMPKGSAPLTAREMEILRLLCEYKSRAEIAKELFIQPDTVKYHVGNMLAKTGCSSAAELAIFVISNGYINPLF
ncbi:MAG: response regulator transcription factor [Solobacterium sp.]|nr:response regulator transcription factor [Solobacterium sp.]